MLKGRGSPKLIRSLWFLCSSPISRCLSLLEVSFGMLGKYKGFSFRFTLNSYNTADINHGKNKMLMNKLIQDV